MKPSTLEWIEKAEDDWEAARRVYRARTRPLYDVACFHCQQCVEKYLKARLNEDSISFSKTHDLVKLLGLILPVEPAWAALQPQVLYLADFAVRYRYPGVSATKAKAKDALRDCRKLRRAVRTAWGLPT
ncbi:MAG: HEPN domain-containing protein [Acidobacteria bacterium]|nr:HEPN domain-containing protein [Acidobacteriota bacterium]MBI3422813.1 HEPN domain-containing protein [Acidobacteriota bacterium]